MLIVAFAKFHIQKLSYLLTTIPPCMSHTQKKLLESKKQCFIATDLDINYLYLLFILICFIFSRKPWQGLCLSKQIEYSNLKDYGCFIPLFNLFWF